MLGIGLPSYVKKNPNMLTHYVSFISTGNVHSRSYKGENHLVERKEMINLILVFLKLVSQI